MPAIGRTMDVGQRIREAREDLGMPQSVLARRVGVSRNSVGRYESGDRAPSLMMIEKIAHELRTEPAELLREPVPLAQAPPETGPATAREPIVSIPYDHDTQLGAFREALHALVVARDDAADVVPPGRLVLRDDGERIEIFLEAPSSGASA
jgi:transcriptional regulator with XRE-family HTH domain